MFLAARATLQANQEIQNQSQGDWWPKLILSGDYTEHDQEITTSTSTTNYDYTDKGYALTLTQPLLNANKSAQLDVASAQVKQAEANFTNAAQDLIIRTAQAYFNLLAAQDDLTFSTALRKAIKEQLFLTQQRFNVGLIAITDVHEAQARFDQAEAQYIVARNNVDIENERLRELTGQVPPALAILKADAPLLTPDPDDINEWVKAALNTNANLIAAANSQQAARAEVSKQQAGHYPSLDLVARHSYVDSGTGFFASRETEDNSISLQLSMSLFEGGIINSRTRQARYNYNATEHTYEQTRRAVERETRSAYLNVIASISQVKALAQALVSSEKALEATQAGFEVGTRTAVDVLNAQQERFRAKRDYARARYDYIIQTLQLKKAAGLLAASDVQQINNWLN